MQKKRKNKREMNLERKEKLCTLREELGEKRSRAEIVRQGEREPLKNVLERIAAVLTRDAQILV